MKQLTREEVQSWKDYHRIGSDLQDRVLALLAERDALKVVGEQAVADRDALRERAEKSEADAGGWQKACEEANASGARMLAAKDAQVAVLREACDGVLKDPATKVDDTMPTDTVVKSSHLWAAVREVLADTAKAAVAHDARTRQEARRELQFLAEAVMDEHDEETTGSTALDNLLNVLMDESGHELARLQQIAASEPEGEP